MRRFRTLASELRAYVVATPEGNRYPGVGLAAKLPMVEPRRTDSPARPAGPIDDVEDAPPASAAQGDGDETALAEGLRARDEEAIEDFLSRYRHLLQHCISQFVSEAGTKEDLFQELVTYVLERIDGNRYDPTKGSFGTWLYRVAWCRCVDLKRRENASRRLSTMPSSELTREPADLAPTPAAFANLAISRLGRLNRKKSHKISKPGNLSLLASLRRAYSRDVRLE